MTDICSNLTGFTHQSQPHDTVRRPNSCLSNEWAFDTTRNSDIICSQVNPIVCPDLVNYTKSASFVGQATIFDPSQSKTTTVECTYQLTDSAKALAPIVIIPPEIINPHNICSIPLPTSTQRLNFTQAEVTEWRSVFGANTAWTECMMPNYCSYLGNPADCQADPLTGLPTKACSRFTAQNGDGALCRNFAKLNPNKATQVQKDFCRANRTPDCACLNKDTNKDFLAIQSQVSDNFVSWYRPCRDSSRYVIDQDTINKASIAQPPPCDRFNNIFPIQSQHIKPSQYERLVDCAGIKNPNQLPMPLTSVSNDLLVRYEFLLIAIIVILFAIIIIGFIVRFYNTKIERCRLEKILKQS